MTDVPIPPAFDLPRSAVFDVDRVEISLLDGQHPFERDNADAIAANWQREQAEKPSLFNGTVTLFSNLVFRPPVLIGACHAISYAGFLHWRRQANREAAQHTFAHAMLATSDGALVAIRMAPHTANPGRVYFAAGSFEPVDFQGGICDVDLNMRREVGEETGIDLSAATAEAGYHAFASPVGTVIFRRHVLPWTADETAHRIRAFVAADAEPEIEGPVLLRSARELPSSLAVYMPALIEWHFAHRG